MPQIVINEDFLEEKHVCYFTKESGYGKAHEIRLFKVVERKYPHPDAPDDAWIWVTESHLVEDYRRSVRGDLVLLEAAQNTTRKIQCNELQVTVEAAK